MSQPQSGSNFHRHSLKRSILDSSSVGDVRRLAAVMCENLGFTDVQAGRVGIIINELGTNTLKYAVKGRIILTATGFTPNGIDIVAIDEGLGLDTNIVLRDGFTTGSSPGTGLGAVQRLSDAFDIYSQLGKGTIVFSRVLREPGTAKYDIAAIGIPLATETVSGDGWLVAQEGQGLSILMADGLGHGAHANQATLEATDVFRTVYNEPVDRQLALIHGRLKSTRGAAVFLLSVGLKQLDYIGVGNIRAIWQTRDKMKSLISQNGTAGIQMRTVQVRSEPWDQTGYLILHSDGILSRFNLADYPGLLTKHSAIIAGVLIRDFPRTNDDASVLVVRVAR